jgi:hypothetical protein
LTRTVTEVKVPRRMDWRVMMPNQVPVNRPSEERLARVG